MGSRDSGVLVGGGATFFLIVVTTVTAEEGGFGFLSGEVWEEEVEAVVVVVVVDVDLVVGSALPPKKLIMAAGFSTACKTERCQ